MNRDALFCDGTGSYVIPPEPNEEETIDLLFRTAASDVDCVELYTDGNYYENEEDRYGVCIRLLPDQLEARNGYDEVFFSGDFRR